MLQGGVDNFVIHVYGSGDMQEELKAHVGYGKHLIYHGRVPKEEFLEQWKTYQYTLMPSKFLETFGLVALDSLALGVPVIGIKKGGLLPFVFDDLAVDSYEMFYTTLKTTITDFDPIVRKSQSDRCLQIAADYTMQTRVDRFTGLLPFSSNQDNKSLLLVSDYAVDI
ncbi:MAG: glycosyltransferase [bacterium]|nr:glycosyltransferase [bacterium]